MAEDEERRALERELADELAALTAQDVDEDDYQSGENAKCYVRLDLEKVLRIHELQPVVSDQEKEPTSWELLLQSVERSDREFFQPFHEVLKDIRTSLLDVKLSISSTEQKELCKVDDQSHLPDEQDGLSHNIAVIQSEQIDFPSLDEIVKFAIGTKEDEMPSCKTDKTATACPPESVSDNACTTREPNSLIAEVAPIYPSSNVLDIVHTSPTIIKKQILEDDQSRQKQLQEIARQQEVRESLRIKVQARHQKERDEAERLLRSLQDDFEAQERNAEIARQEEQERSLMANEESQCQLYVAAECEYRETALMVLADEASHKVATEFARIQDAINNEIAQMVAEDRAERHRMQVERQLRDQSQESLARCRLSAVLSEMIGHHELQQQIRDQEIKRERRECVHMRAEEANTRRVIAKTRALREQQERERNRALMLHEDEVASTLEHLERNRNLKAKERVREENCRVWMEKEETQTRSAWTFIENLHRMHRQNEERSRLTMQLEEERCRCDWAYLAELARTEAKIRENQSELHRLRVVASVSAGLQSLDRVFRQHSLVKCVKRWRRWYEHCVEEDLTRAKTADNAAKRIQMWHRSHRQRIQQLVSADPPLILEDFSDDEEQPQVDEDKYAEVYANCSASQEAALRLQSTFRGFHVRRKFANALALAQAVGKHEEGDFFDAVDLDDLIQLPPELVDGWEDPVLPAASIVTQRKYPPRQEGFVGNNEMEEYVEAVESLRNLETCKMTAKSVPSTPTSGDPPKEHNLAATLWNKMKRAKNRQRHAQQERQRQQDPAYRAQKLLNRKPNARHASGNQSTHSNLQGGQMAPSMVSWSSTANAKKKPKVKLPSLVERLRRQTMAER